MSERLHLSGEHKTEAIDTSAEAQKNLERLREKAEQAEKDPLQKHVESLTKSVEAQAISGKELNVGDKQGESSVQTFGAQKELKTDAYKRTLRKIQSQMSTPERIASRIIHQPVVDSISTAAGKTVARPSGFLGGGIIAFVGTTVYLYLTKHYGYHYNYTVLFVLFIGGFATGLILELLLRVIFLRRKARY